MKIIYLIALLLPAAVIAQDTGADARANLERAERFGRRAGEMVRGGEMRYFWSPDETHLVWRVDVAANDHRFFSINLASGEQSPAFDHELLAKELATASGEPVAAEELPIEQLELDEGHPHQFRFRAFGKSWRYESGSLHQDDRPPTVSDLLAPEDAPRGTRRNGEATQISVENATKEEIEIFWVDGSGQRRSYGRLAVGETFHQNTYAGHLWLMTDAEGVPLAAIEAPDAPAVARVTGRVEASARPARNISPDGRWQALIRRHNLFIRPVDGGDEIQLSQDGSRENRYQPPLRWSPDSRKLVAMRTRHVETRKIHLVESSPPDQLQPKLRTLDYNKPGDPIRQPKPRLFHIDPLQEVALSDALFDNPWEIRDLAWAADSSEFSFVYNQRGHQVMRLVAIRADSGSARTVYEERSDTFIDYSQKYYLRRLRNNEEILWTSERDGNNHLYRIELSSGSIHPVTQGEWQVREVVEVNEEQRTAVLRIVGLPGQDPYHSHFVRVDLDGGDFTRLTEGDGTHRLTFSPTQKHYVATWSRVDQPPVAEIRRSRDGKLIGELGRADDSELQATGWARPERFVAKGRDGITDIYGIIIRPRNFDPNKKYPIVEDIYAGPHDHFVPKAYSSWSGLNTMAELGFIVVKIDGMGTNWRGKTFHDVAWKNLADSGFPDRILWIEAAAKSRPWMDLTRIGIFGGSAGGQSALAALLHHGDFYKVAVADCGCHDNRMDKIWWNEAWMGWPVDQSYVENSNVTHAAKLEGKLMLIVGELDSNVDPASTAQVVHALQQADKEFDFVPIINAGHGAAETPYGKRRRAAFLVRHLLDEQAATP